ncbi:MAG: hypothetical protein KDI42_08840, partial [Gammaproteobacteria bacterium]|nr:hypothetical protein [Gammaproteobacteria bacterium]
NLILLSVAIIVLALPSDDPASYREALAMVSPVSRLQGEAALLERYGDWRDAAARTALRDELNTALAQALPDAIQQPTAAAPLKSNWTAGAFRTWFAECRARLPVDADNAALFLRTAVVEPEPERAARGWPIAISASTRVVVDMDMSRDQLPGWQRDSQWDWQRDQSLARLAQVIAAPTSRAVPQRVAFEPGTIRNALFADLPQSVIDARSGWVLHADELELVSTPGGFTLRGAIYPLYDWITLSADLRPNRPGFTSPWNKGPATPCQLPTHRLANVADDDAYYWGRHPIDAPLADAPARTMPGHRFIDWLHTELGIAGDDSRWALTRSPLWPKLADKSPAAAEDWLHAGLSELEAEPSIDIFGFRFAGATLLLAAPIAVLALLIYLLIHLQAARGRNGDPDGIAWMGIYDTLVARIVTALTLGALPAVALFTAAWRFQSLGRMWLPLIGGIAAITLGLLCLRLLAELRQRQA